jgi:hypothetical protein
MRNEGDAIDLAEQYLEKLHAELQKHGLDSEIIALGSRPRLRLDTPPGYADADFEDNVLVAKAQDGRWMFWWPSLEQIAPADDLVKAAEVIID